MPGAEDAPLRDGGISSLGKSQSRTRSSVAARKAEIHRNLLKGGCLRCHGPFPEGRFIYCSDECSSGAQAEIKANRQALGLFDLD